MIRFHYFSSKIFTLLLMHFPLFGSLSLEEKVGQLLMVHFHGEIANEQAKALIQDVKVGAIIYYNWANGLHCPKQVQNLSASLQQLTEANPHPIPLLIAADQEGGIVSRLNTGFTEFPGNRALGETSLPDLSNESAFAMAQELLAVGINMNLAPVVDIHSNPRNSVIGIRSFGEEPETVTSFGRQALAGYHRAHMITTLKHFPGHGDVEVDSHEGLPIVLKSKEELELTELLPFAKLAPFSDAMMTAHLLVPAFDSENCSTLSEKTLTYLREVIGFQGVIVADSLVMEGVLKKCKTVDEAAIQALIAGCDLLILGGKLLSGHLIGYELTTTDIKRIHRSLVKAVQEGRVPEKRVDQAVEKILNLKKRIASQPVLFDEQAHRTLAKKVASLALKTVKTSEMPCLKDKRLAMIAPKILSDSIEQTSFVKMGKSWQLVLYSQLDPLAEEIEEIKQQVKKADLLIVCSYNAWKNPSQIQLIQSLLDSGKPVVLLVVRDPQDADLFPTAHLIFKTFSPCLPSLQTVSEQDLFFSK